MLFMVTHLEMIHGARLTRTMKRMTTRKSFSTEDGHAAEVQGLETVLA